MPHKIIDLTGKTFGKWTVLHRDGNISPVRWICKCECGEIKSVQSSSLRRGQSTCCRHCKQNTAPYYVRTHKNRLYHAWSEMLRRCRGRCTNHQYYGDKGISYCKEWEEFDKFAEWADKSGYQEGLEIDRIDSDKDYSPENCRWVSHKKNSRNRKARSNNETGTPGVQIRRYGGGRIVYRVTISSDNGRVNVGTFKTLEQAVAARKDAEIKYWGFNIGE